MRLRVGLDNVDILIKENVGTNPGVSWVLWSGLAPFYKTNGVLLAAVSVFVPFG
jgi:hypothetical protein